MKAIGSEEFGSQGVLELRALQSSLAEGQRVTRSGLGASEAPSQRTSYSCPSTFPGTSPTSCTNIGERCVVLRSSALTPSCP